MKQNPSLASVFDLSALPAAFGPLDTLVGQIRHRDLLIETSAENDAKFYSLTIVTRELALDLLGSGLKLIFFPAADETAESEFDVAFEYRWAILRYVPEFETLSFAHSARAFFDIFLNLVDITEKQLLAGIVEALIDDPTPYQTLVAKLSAWQSGASPLAGLTLTNQPPGYSEIEYIIQQVPANVDIFVAAFEAVVEDISDVDKSIDNLVTLFRRWLGNIARDDIEQLLLPQFSLGLQQVAMAIEVPRSVLVPLDTNNEPISDTTKHSRLTFTAGGVRYDSSTGFDIALDQNIAASFTKSIIPGFGMTLEFDDIKIDLSRTTNIAEADAEGRPTDFMGVYIGNAVIGLPKKWFDAHQPASGTPVTLGIVGRALRIGTGGLSGTIGLEVLVAGRPKATKDKHSGPEELEFILGKQPPPSGGARKGLKLGFSSFDMKFRQNVLLESKIKGSMTIPKFDADPIGIELFIAQDGDFKVTASVAAGHLFKAGNVFSFLAKSLSVEKDDNRVFIEAKGDLSFKDNQFIGAIIKAPIHIEKLRIGSDVSIELEGGTIPLPESVIIPLGPAKIAITAIHFGAHEQERNGVMRQYRYWGFDGGINVNPGGIDARGDGIKYYYTVDGLDFHDFLRIEGIGIDLVIPGTASKDKAVVLLKGYLALKNPVYQGSISFQLPQVQIAGGAAMAYNTKVPAWIVDTWLELPMPIPLGATGLGIYGFRGLFGLRYVASKEAITQPAPLPEDASWGDYYRAPQPEKGVDIRKFLTPERTPGASNPFSVGAGVSLATAQDKGKAFTSQLFLLVSVPDLIMLEGRFDVLADARVGLTDEDPPYYAYLVLSRESIELGAGASYLVPKDTGAVLDLNAVFEAAYFFHNRDAWYIHVGTKPKPITARIISMFDAYAYFMLSASGIETGAGVHFDFEKKYGPVAVSAHAYLDLWAYVSFERQQAGGGIALGGYVDARVLGLAFNITLAAGLTVEVPKPFYIAGYAEVCVTVNLRVKKFHKCVDVKFIWERSNEVDTLAILAFPTIPPSPDLRPAKGIHMASGRTYEVDFRPQSMDPSDPDFSAMEPIPLDTYIDVKFAKPVDPSAVTLRIGGFTNPPSGTTEIMPPQYGSRIVTHSYAVTDVALQVWGSGGWIDYHPFLALAPEALADPTTVTNLADLPIGVWQKQETGYSQIRFLALTPFNYMEPIGGYRPEELGLTAQTIFCQGRTRDEKCVLWDAPGTYPADTNHYRDGILFRVEGADAATVSIPLGPLAPVSLAVRPGARGIFLFPERTVSCRLLLFSTAPQVTIRFQRREPAVAEQDPVTGAITFPYAAAKFADVHVLPIARGALGNPVAYADPAGIDRIILETPGPNVQATGEIEERIVYRREDFVRANPRDRPTIEADIAKLTGELAEQRAKFCVEGRIDVAVPRLPKDWQCGTFVHEICWLSEQDNLYNQMIPGMAAIEADFHNMRAAVQSTIAPIWRPHQFYRIVLTVKDVVTGPAATVATELPFYVHFRTGGPLGYFAKSLAAPDVATSTAAPLNVPQDERDEIPERFLKFYIDMERSYPDPSGHLLYAKPLYYGRVVLKLFLAKPYAYHFFAQWPAYAGLPATNYALEVRIKDPAEAVPSSGTPDHEAPFVTAALTGTQAWRPDAQTRVTEDLKILNNFQDPTLLGATHDGMACLSTGGDPIIPAAKVLETTIEDLEPNKLYTAVVLNRWLDVSPIEEREVHRYPFKTSLFRDFRSHIESYKLNADPQNLRRAVFRVSHPLAPAAAAPPMYDTALKIIKRELTADPAYPDFFDRLVYACLKLAPLPPAPTLEFNFVENNFLVENNSAAEVYGLWLRNPEPFNDPRLPETDLYSAIALYAAGIRRSDAHLLLSKDGCQAFVMIEGGAFPTSDVSFDFRHLDSGETVTTEQFSKP